LHISGLQHKIMWNVPGSGSLKKLRTVSRDRMETKEPENPSGA